jgi:hypothetical protein
MSNLYEEGPDVNGYSFGLTTRSKTRRICCLLVIPTIAVCCVIGICFTLGASPPGGLLRRPRIAPWDYLTATKVTDERAQPEANGDFGHAILEPIDLAGATRRVGNTQQRT